MKLPITKIVFLHALGSIYEIFTGNTYTQRVLLPKLIRKLTGSKTYASKAEQERLNTQASRSI